MGTVFIGKDKCVFKKVMKQTCCSQVKQQKNHSPSKAAVHLAYMVKGITGAKYNAKLFSLYSGCLVTVGRAKSWCMCTGKGSHM